MKKFRINKGDKAADDASEDPNRSRLFGSKSKSKGSPAASTNPYAVPQAAAASDPYAAPSAYSNPSAGGGYNDRGYNAVNQSTSQQSPPPAYPNTSNYGGGYSNDPMRNGKSPVPPGGYSGSRSAAPNPGYGGQQGYGSSNSYGANSYGGGGTSGGSYGDNRYGDNPYGGNSYGNSGYGNNATSGNTASSAYQRPGGYGGLGRSTDEDAEETQVRKEALFGHAKERYQEREAQNTLPPEEDPALGGSGGTGEHNHEGYGSYGNRQLTAEEEEEEDVQAAKQQIRAIKQQDVSSTRNALRIAEQAEQTGRETLERLGQQGDRIHNTERNLDLASNQNRLAEEKARELKHLNRSMWAMRVGNPFTKQRRERERDDAIMTQHQSERAERQATRQAAYESQMRKDETQREIRGTPIQRKSNLAERSKYQFEADSEDEAMEDEIDGNLDALHGAAGRLHQLGLAMGDEVDAQNKHIDRIVGKADKVDDQIVMNRSRLDRIK